MNDEVVLNEKQMQMVEESPYDFTDLRAMFINCTLKRSPEVSNTQGLMDISIEIMRRNGVEVECIRAIDHQIATGVWPDMTEHGWEADEWPQIFEQVMASDILVLGMSIWLGEKSSVATQIVERLYGNSHLLNDDGQYAYYGRVGGCLVTGNEDGVKHCAMNTLYSLQHLGYTIPPQADSGWIGEAGPGPSYLDEGSGGPENDFTNRNTTFATWNLLHVARMLKDAGGIPAHGNQRTEWDAGCRFDFPNPEHRAAAPPRAANRDRLPRGSADCERRLRPPRRAADRDRGLRARPATTASSGTSPGRRPSSTSTAAGEEGIGEDVVYDVLDHIAHRDAGPVLDLTAPTTLGEACELLGELDLFPGAPPGARRSRGTTGAGRTSRRRSTWRCARTGSRCGRSSSATRQPLRFVCSTRLAGFGDDGASPRPSRSASGSTKYPGLEFKLDPENDWDEELIAEIAEIAPVAGARPEGHVPGHAGRRRDRPGALPRGRRDVPRRLPRGPRPQRRDPRGTRAAPTTGSPGTRRCTRSPTSRSWPASAINSKPSRFGSLEELLAIYEYCDQNGIAIYGGGQGELQCGRGQIQYLASLFHAGRRRTTWRRPATTTPRCPRGMPTSPMDPAPSETGFRWAE